MSIQVFFRGVLIGTALRSGGTIYVRSAEGAPIGAVADFDAAAALLMRRIA
ncbi:hypothetical protein [Methylobacterium sp.]|uniref:hypothetical protein n=1 Tax=Methylobacterium sp. TaxID=409 RepID=UPI0025DAFE71|nr:hypothetical protein [Methylobacterium sp.]MBY0256119.1 hypothetical protein [Methylobacterium sp.]